MYGDNNPLNEHDAVRPGTESETDVYDDEEVPTLVLVVIVILAVLTAALYLSLGGGHNHFH